MANKIRKFIGVAFSLDWKIALTTIISTLLLMIDYYYKSILHWEKWFTGLNSTGITGKVLDRTLLYFIIPIFIIIVVFRERPRTYGFSFGEWRIGILITLVAILLLTPVLWFLGHKIISLQEYYSPMFSGLPWNTFLDLFGWEFFFRGWILFVYSHKFGPEALWLQAVPFALAHLGKPELETLSTIFGGFAFGWVAWRTKSFFYGFLIHWFIGSFIILVASGRL